MHVKWMYNQEGGLERREYLAVRIVWAPQHTSHDVVLDDMHL